MCWVGRTSFWKATVMKTLLAFGGLPGRCGAVAGLTLLIASPAAAHHSYSMFDRSKTITLNGTVRTWELVNPHSFLWVVVPTKDSHDEIWGLEGGGVMALVRAGLNKSSVKPGDKITVDLHPLRDGRTGGMLLKVTLADGKVLQMGGAEPPKAPGETDAPTPQ